MAIEWITAAQLGVNGLRAIAALINSKDIKKREQLVEEMIQQIEALRQSHKLLEEKNVRLEKILFALSGALFLTVCSVIGLGITILSS